MSVVYEPPPTVTDEHLYEKALSVHNCYSMCKYITYKYINFNFTQVIYTLCMQIIFLSKCL